MRNRKNIREKYSMHHKKRERIVENFIRNFYMPLIRRWNCDKQTYKLTNFHHLEHIYELYVMFVKTLK